MTRWTLILTGACLLAACGGPPISPQPTAPLGAKEAAPEPELSAPRPAPGLDWHFQHDGAYGKLTYGPKDSDDVRLILTCSPKSGQVTVAHSVAAAQAGTPPTLTLVSGTAKAVWLATTRPSPQDAGSTELSATASTTDPVLRAFARRGWVTVVTGPQIEGLAPQPGTQAVRQFFDFCG